MIDVNVPVIIIIEVNVYKRTRRSFIIEEEFVFYLLERHSHSFACQF